MNMINHLFKLCLFASSLLLITACATERKPFELSLMKENQQQASFRSHPNLKVEISEKFAEPQSVESEDYSNINNFREITPWLRNRLSAINNLNCPLNDKINIIISVKKLYTTYISNIEVGVVLLNANITTTQGRTLNRNYRGDCKMSYFSMNQKTGLQACLNSSLDLIISDIKKDICKLSANQFYSKRNM